MNLNKYNVKIAKNLYKKEWFFMNVTNRAYNLVLREENFGHADHIYVLLGLENGKTWNLLGGKQDPSEKTRGITAARELYEESGKFFDKRKNKKYWEKLSSYEWGDHKVFIHKPGDLPFKISKLDAAAKACINNPNLPHDYKEMHRYQLIRLTDLVALADAQTVKGANGYFKHNHESNIMEIDGWLLYTLKNADRNSINDYLY